MSHDFECSKETRELIDDLRAYFLRCADYERKRPKSRPPESIQIIDDTATIDAGYLFNECKETREQYHEYRSLVRKSQVARNISGIIWYECSFNGKSVKVPEIHDQLTYIPRDKEILVAAKQSIVNWFLDVTTGLEITETLFNGEDIPCSRETLLNYVPEYEFADCYCNESLIHILDNGKEVGLAKDQEFVLNLIYGSPTDYPFVWAKDSGARHFSAEIIHETFNN